MHKKFSKLSKLPRLQRIPKLKKQIIKDIVKEIIYGKMDENAPDDNALVYTGRKSKKKLRLLTNKSGKNIVNVKSLVAKLCKDKELCGKIIMSPNAFIKIMKDNLATECFDIDEDKGVYLNNAHKFIFKEDRDDVKNQEYNSYDEASPKYLSPVSNAVDEEEGEDLLSRIKECVKSNL